jgi:hypothetical protein
MSRQDDHAWQLEQRNRVLVPYYRSIAFEGRFVLLDSGRLAKGLQIKVGIDTIIQMAGGQALAIEEKIVRWPGYNYACFALETDSCTNVGEERPGWMRYSLADYLLYCFENDPGPGLNCWWVDMQKLKQWFWPRVETFETFGPLDTPNRSMGRKVPIQQVRSAVPARFRFVPCPSSTIAIAENGAHMAGTSATGIADAECGTAVST